MNRNFNTGSFVIDGLAGQRKLSGEIKVSGAKNAAIKVMVASIIFDGPICLEGIPEIEDVNRISELLSAAGIDVNKTGNHSYTLTASDNLSEELDAEISRTTRSSIVAVAPLLAHTGRVVFSNPGGCNLGSRPIDLFIEGYEKMGASVSQEGDRFEVVAKDGKLKGANIFFRIQSHTATETFMMAAVLAEGRTVLENCALEPEVKSLADFLIKCGADIKGAGTHTIVIEGGKPLESKGVIYKTIPDRLETGSFMILGALTGEKIKITGCNAEHVRMTIETLRHAGIEIETGKDEIIVKGKELKKGLPVRTHEYPGLPTDLQAPMAVFLTQAPGESSIFEAIYEDRLGYVNELKNMGADIKLQDSHRAIIKGPTPLKATGLTAPDIRAGLAFIIAGAIAEGETIIHNAYMIDRGYENLENRLREIGLSIKRLKD
ncbi:MAG: UDP-N-acetylglucosamine 1-carboxyvinyltransferase [Parcubacteria group bacterium CG11_big_fil_rev_8_21_14_0_20_39_22]|nr:MAG: UDP-N-acetylglucosamine 1-carboxyvinyltransferase [Parcubacteria group bacterium CG11_big_fil_rev_8_21_14_0_20_39_22]